MGDPYWHSREDRPRKVSELISYCGYAVDDEGVAYRRQRGQKVQLEPRGQDAGLPDRREHIKFTGAEFISKGKTVSRARSPYRDTYDAAKEKAKVAVHRKECPRCGVCGVCGNQLAVNKKEHMLAYGCPDARRSTPPPAPPVRCPCPRPGARAVAKTVLKDLWEEARSYYERE